MKVRGKVIRRRVGRGSKSEHEAVVLVTDAGVSYHLHQPGGNAFEDPELEQLVGKRIEGNGAKRGVSFYLAKWREL
jgi:hypothetical protein